MHNKDKTSDLKTVSGRRTPGLIFSLVCCLLLFSGAGTGAAELVDSTRYILGPGDEFTVGFFGAQIDDLVFDISLEGVAVIPGVGSYPLAGLKLAEAREKLRAGLVRVYSGVTLSVSLTKVRDKRTLVSGAVVNPGLYESSAILRSSDLIALAGGLTPKASRRNIVIRSQTENFPVDLQMFFLVGELESNPPVYLGEVVHVPLAPDSSSRIYVAGEVRSPGWVEYTGRDNLADLIALAGGLTNDLARNDSALLISPLAGQLSRLVSMEDNTPVPAAAKVIALASSASPTNLSVAIGGEALYPGRYAFSEGLDVGSLIQIAGGLTAEAYVTGTVIFGLAAQQTQLLKSLREITAVSPTKDSPQKPDGFFQQAQVRSLSENVVNDLLQPGDSVFVPARTEAVTVLGQVKRPGLTPFSKNTSVGDYLNQVGGVTSWADMNGSYLVRRLSQAQLPLSSVNRVYDGDMLVIARKTKSEGGFLKSLRDVALVGAGVALTYFAIDQAGN